MAAKANRSLSFTSITSSTAFKIIVGKSRHEHFVHASLLASQSPVLHALVNNGMKECNERTVTWENVAEHTFQTFCEFAYTGNFEINRPSEERNDLDEALHTSWLKQYAEIMVFADYYAMDSLLVVAHSKLEAVLSSLTFDETDLETQDILQSVSILYKYCYSREIPEILHNAIYAFLEEHGLTLWKDSNFQEVVASHQPLALDLIKCLAQHKCAESNFPKVLSAVGVKHRCNDCYLDGYLGSFTRQEAVVCKKCGKIGDLLLP